MILYNARKDFFLPKNVRMTRMPRKSLQKNILEIGWLGCVEKIENSHQT